MDDLQGVGKDGFDRLRARECQKSEGEDGFASFESSNLHPHNKKSNTEKCWTFCGGGGRIRYICSQWEQIKVSIPSSRDRAKLHWSFAFNYSNPHQSRKETHRKVCLFSGGGGRIRTIEAIRSRFTVCPLWPLGNSPIFNWLDWSR